MVGHRATIVIGGVTASGKSQLALTLAERMGGVVINADSVQLYRDLPILTARPVDADLNQAPHRLYGFLGPNDTGSVAQWLSWAQTEIESAHRAGRQPIVVGGTGMYIAALCQGLPAMPDIDPDIRDFVRQMTLEALARELAERDAPMHDRLPTNDRQRRARALEVVLSTGRSLAEWQKEPANSAVRNVKLVSLLPERAAVRARAWRRASAMIELGAVAQIEDLWQRHGDPREMAIKKAIGVDEIAAYLAGQSDLSTAVERIGIRTGQYVKRQETWFRRQLPQALRVEDFGDNATSLDRVWRGLGHAAG